MKERTNTNNNNNRKHEQVASYLLTTMGMGRVSMKMPQRAQRPPISFPGKVEGESSP